MVDYREIYLIAAADRDNFDRTVTPILRSILDEVRHDSRKVIRIGNNDAHVWSGLMVDSVAAWEGVQ